MTTADTAEPLSHGGAVSEEPKMDSGSPAPETLNVTLLLMSALRVSIRVDSQFLKAHDAGDDTAPGDFTVGALKDVLFGMWHENWGNAPVDPSHIRLIHLGKVLEEEQTLDQCGIVPEGANVVHMSVKPESFDLETPVKVQKKSMLRHRRGNSSTGGGDHGSRGNARDSSSGRQSSGGCCIIL